jgi:hypothetical protein
MMIEILIKMYNININEENIFTLLRDFHMELQRHLREGNITNIFSVEIIRMFGTI